MKKLLSLIIISCILFNTCFASYTYHRIALDDTLLPVNCVIYKDNDLYFISKDNLQSNFNYSIWEANNIIYISNKSLLITIKDSQVSINWSNTNKTIETRIINNKLFFDSSILNYLGYIVNFDSQYDFMYLTTPQKVYSLSIEKFISVNKSVLLDSLNNKSNLINIDGVYPPINSNKTAYLTFDDGPSVKITTKILDILKEYDVKVTFFMQGDYAKNNANLVKRVYDEGHSIGNHTFSHKRSIYNSESVFRYELERTNNIIRDITGSTPKYFRPPYGQKLTSGQNKILKDLNLTFMKWNVDSGDSHGKNISRARIYNNIVRSVGKSNNVIILMHDNDGHSENIHILKNIIKALWQKGYNLKSL